MSSKPTTARKPALEPPPTIAELAAALEISTRRVSQLKLDGLPTHSIAAALEWRRAQNQTDSAERLRLERIKLVQAQRERVELENAQNRNELISRSEVETSDTRIGAAVAAAMKALETELPQLLLGLSLERSLPITKEKCRAIQTMLADEQSAFWAAHPAGKNG
jgi:phage terminase Nu1 subunit (DNA packaging protein)